MRENGGVNIKIDLWEFDLNEMADRGNWWALLSEDERDRAQRYRRSRDRQQFVTARGLLRQCLGDYLDLAPHNVRFHYGTHGKPEIAPDLQSTQSTQSARSLQFNTSHSGGVALLGFSWDGAIGVDLEAPRSMSDLQCIKLARRFFLVPEFEVLEQCVQPERAELFFHYWTCKEAYLKATGIGLSHLQQAPIYFDDHQQPKPIVNSNGQSGIVQKISLRCGYPAAIAAIGNELTYRWHNHP